MISPLSPNAKKLTVGSLFSGIGGLDLGLERAGMEVRWQSEIDPYCSRVLAKHWPHVPNLGDVTKIEWSDVERVDVLCGGFPCQDISDAHTNGVRRGLEGNKSGLWLLFEDAIFELWPRFVIIENVNAWRRWLPTVQGTLMEFGYGVVSCVLPAGLFGAPHRRPRTFVVADSDSESESLCALDDALAGLRAVPAPGGFWGTPAPGGLRMDDGVPSGMDRCRVLGNAVVPQVAQFVGEALLEAINADV